MSPAFREFYKTKSKYASREKEDAVYLDIDRRDMTRKIIPDL
jgi:DNA-dependent RNA polymerase auxiliary subunit epsilon